MAYPTVGIRVGEGRVHQAEGGALESIQSNRSPPEVARAGEAPGASLDRASAREEGSRCESGTVAPL